jgi:hypothetical protein
LGDAKQISDSSINKSNIIDGEEDFKAIVGNYPMAYAEDISRILPNKILLRF